MEGTGVCDYGLGAFGRCSVCVYVVEDTIVFASKDTSYFFDCCLVLTLYLFTNLLSLCYVYSLRY